MLIADAVVQLRPTVSSCSRAPQSSWNWHVRSNWVSYHMYVHIPIMTYHFNSVYQQQSPEQGETKHRWSNYQEPSKVPLFRSATTLSLPRLLTRPYTISIVLDRPIRAEFSHGKGSLDGSFIPFIMVSSPEIIHESLSLDV
jgi:hypothetical protein